MNFIYVIKKSILREIYGLKYNKIGYKLFLLNIFFTLAWVVFFVFNIFHINNEFYSEVAIVFCMGLIFLTTALSCILIIRYIKNVDIDKDDVIKNFVEMLMLELREPLSFAKLQSEILNEILANIEKRKTDVINADEHYEYCLTQKEYDSFRKVTKISAETSQYGIDLIENYTISFREPKSNHQAITKEFSIKSAIDKAIKICSVPFPEVKNIEIDVEDFCVKSNFNYVKHVMINCIKNAYIHNGRDVRLKINGNRKALYITDYGQGIEKNMIKSIFNKFYSRHRGGVGMGLYFCRYAMEKIGGSIQCESVEGQYTKFILDFSEV